MTLLAGLSFFVDSAGIGRKAAGECCRMREKKDRINRKCEEFVIKRKNSVIFATYFAAKPHRIGVTRGGGRDESDTAYEGLSAGIGE